jgi:hypothetical protein
MTQDERLDQLQLPQVHLGRVFPLWGVGPGPDGVLRCECRQWRCKSAGKHPRRKGWIKQASDDPGISQEWMQKYPNGKFGVLIGERVMVVDPDMKPGEKDGGRPWRSWKLTAA